MADAPSLIETIGKGSALAGVVAIAARVIFSWARRLGLADSLSAAEAAHRSMLKVDIDELRARLSDTEAGMREARDAAAQEHAARLAIEGELKTAKLAHALLEREIELLKREVALLHAAWDPNRTLPPGLR